MSEAGETADGSTRLFYLGCVRKRGENANLAEQKFFLRVCLLSHFLPLSYSFDLFVWLGFSFCFFLLTVGKENSRGGKLLCQVILH